MPDREHQPHEQTTTSEYRALHHGQALALGYDRKAFTRLVEQGALRRPLTGVYLDGPCRMTQRRAPVRPGL